MGKINLGKTATSRSRRKKVVGQVSATRLPENDFIAYMLGKGYSSLTTESYYSALEKFQAWLIKQNLEIENVQYNDIVAYLQSMTSIAQHTKGCYLRGVKHYFNYLIGLGERVDNPVEFIKIKGIKRKRLYDILNRQELDSLYSGYTLPDEQGRNKNQNWFQINLMVQKRNKVILGLILYQALDSRDLKLLTIHDVKLREGKILIPGTRKSNERDLKLESLQIMDMMEYLSTIRNDFLALTGKQTDQLFISTGGSDHVRSIMTKLVKRLKHINKKVTSVKQLRASVIVHWLKIYNLRQAQYMAGHRYVSSTESFLVNEMEGMIGEIEKYHPIV